MNMKIVQKEIELLLQNKVLCRAFFRESVKSG